MGVSSESRSDSGQASRILEGNSSPSDAVWFHWAVDMPKSEQLVPTSVLLAVWLHVYMLAFILTQRERNASSQIQAWGGMYRAANSRLENTWEFGEQGMGSRRFGEGWNLSRVQWPFSPGGLISVPWCFVITVGEHQPPPEGGQLKAGGSWNNLEYAKIWILAVKCFSSFTFTESFMFTE